MRLVFRSELLTHHNDRYLHTIIVCGFKVWNDTFDIIKIYGTWFSTETNITCTFEIEKSDGKIEYLEMPAVNVQTRLALALVVDTPTISGTK